MYPLSLFPFRNESAQNCNALTFYGNDHIKISCEERITKERKDEKVISRFERRGRSRGGKVSHGVVPYRYDVQPPPLPEVEERLAGAQNRQTCDSAATA